METSKRHHMITSINDQLSKFAVSHFQSKKTPFAFFAEIPETCETDELKNYLSPEECARAARFYFRTDHDSFVVAHAIKRLALGAMTCQTPSDVPLAIGSHGKPKLIHACDEGPIQFSLSHTKGVVAFAVAFQAPIGVDVECVNLNIDTANLAKTFLASQDTDLLNSVADTERQETFFQLWTAKEAYIKGIGLGMSHPLKSFFVEALDHKSRICDSQTGASLNWITQSCQPTPKHYMSSAIESQSASDDQVTFLELPFQMIG
ncbi:4'-phosphopantetheinyl transferase superfamily protein [Pseudovibrio sp. Ad46]|uniref:4'-phosphopantetheinyl transferase family protein n=2 Tax=unclassified Pseudovibrio TaxID=2627060 RepID=UPI0009EB4751|nr:4'-phosphopantetheinyl transferase superfamily protein [Pseudovibrio sp. Ad46]